MAENTKRKAARRVLNSSGYRVGGHLAEHPDEAQDKKLIAKAMAKDEKKDKKMVTRAITEHDDQLHGGKKTKLKLKDGGVAEGGEARARGDKKPRGKPNVKIDIIVGKSGPGMMPPPPMAMMPPPAAMGAPPMAGPPPGAGGMPPPGLKRGGRAKKRDGGGLPMRDPIPALEPTGGTRLKDGGRAKRVKNAIKDYPIDDGAGGGMGRLEKIEAYGARHR